MALGHSFNATGLPSKLGGAPSTCGWPGAVECLWPNGLGECCGAEGGRVLWEDELTTAARKPLFGPRPMH
jgi:hypothetical protein